MRKRTKSLIATAFAIGPLIKCTPDIVGIPGMIDDISVWEKWLEGLTWVDVGWATVFAGSILSLMWINIEAPVKRWLHKGDKGQSARDGKPDYGAWREVERLELWQVACLWAEVEPALPIPPGKPQIRMHMLRQAIGSHQLKPNWNQIQQSAIAVTRIANAPLNEQSIPERTTISWRELARFFKVRDTWPEFMPAYLKALEPAPSPQPSRDPDPPPAPATSRLLVECSPSQMILTVPPSGKYYVLQLFPLPVANGGGGLLQYFGNPGSTLDWGDSYGPSDIVYKCEITNYGSETLADVHLVMRLKFIEAVPRKGQPGALDSGGIVLERDWPIQIAKIDPGEMGKFIFLAVNLSEHFGRFDFPDTGTAQPVNGRDRVTVEIMKPLARFLTLSPRKAFRKSLSKPKD